MNKNPLITLSIVSHGQAKMIGPLLADLVNLPEQIFEVIITINVPEDEKPFCHQSLPIRFIRNKTRKGFGANHNAAFAEAEGKFFAVVNPDIRAPKLDLKALLDSFSDQRVAAVAPLIISADGNLEDSARRFPTLKRFAKRVILRQRKSDYDLNPGICVVDWVAGMFVIFRSDAYRQVAGFDDNRFFMYLEDADICRRLHKNGWAVLVNSSTSVIHLAQRASHKNFKHMWWHSVSAVRFLTGL